MTKNRNFQENRMFYRKLQFCLKTIDYFKKNVNFTEKIAIIRKNFHIYMKNGEFYQQKKSKFYKKKIEKIEILSFSPKKSKIFNSKFLQVSEKVCDLLKKQFGASDSRFVTSGREDIDVRMLGTGRPFVVELRNCRTTAPVRGIKYLETLKTVQEAINVQKDVKVVSLTRVPRDVSEKLCVGEEGACTILWKQKMEFGAI